MARTVTKNGRSVAGRRQHPASPNPAGQGPPASPRSYDWSQSQYNEVLLSQLYGFGFGPDGPMRTVGLTSAKRGEGVTTVACSLALYAADCHGMSVLLVDANHASPQLNSVFRIKDGPGLAELLNGDDLQLADCVHDLSSQPLDCWPAQLRQVLRRNRVRSRQSRNREELSAPRLSILPSGMSPLPARGRVSLPGDNPLDRLGDHFDLVIVDLPAVESPRGCGFSLSDLGAVLFVLKAESTSEVVAQKGLRQLAKNGGNVLGIVFNQRRTHLPKWIDKRLGD